MDKDKIAVKRINDKFRAYETALSVLSFEYGDGIIPDRRPEAVMKLAKQIHEFAYNDY